MSDRWVVDEDYPGGHLVPMTRSEEAQLRKDRKAGAVAAAAQAELHERAVARLAGLRKARVDLEAGVIFASLSAKDRNVIALLLGDV